MVQNSLMGSKFYLTARAGEQLPCHEEKMTKTMIHSNMGEYVSTVEQNLIASKEQNDAIRYSARAGFSLRMSNPVKYFNAYIKRANRDNNVA